MIIFQIIIALTVIFLVLQRPYLGVVFMAASLPVADILPAIPYMTSVVPLIGAVTLAAFLLSRKKEHPGPFRFANVHMAGLLFIIWLFVSNPQVAWFGLDRNWFFTFFQLWVLVWLAGELLDTPEKHRHFMWLYCIATLISALIAIQQGNLGGEIDPATRVYGLAQGANTAARYFVVAMVFLNYLRTVSPNRLIRLFTVGGAIVTLIGVFFTVSRTSILLVFVAIGLMVLLQPGLSHRFQLGAVFVIALVVLWFLAGNVFDIVKAIAPAIAGRTDTVGLRFALWKAGWRMWLDHPFQGVGVGMFPRQLRFYGQDLMAPLFWKGAVAHNMYVQILAETGLVGFGIFATLLISSLRNFLRAGNITDLPILSLRNVWLVAFLVMLIGGITKTDQADKMLWLAIGTSVYFYKQARMNTQEKLVSYNVHEMSAEA